MNNKTLDYIENIITKEKQHKRLNKNEKILYHIIF